MRQPQPAQAPSGGSTRVLLWVGGLLVAVVVAGGLGVWFMFSQYARFVAEMPAVMQFDAAAEHSKAMQTLDAAQDPYDRWLALDDAAMWSVDVGDLDQGRRLAEELLRNAENHKQDWNYGNAIHKGNLILGRVALRQDDVVQAKQRLLAAGRTPGSPQLDSFGPNLKLAEELLQRGERQVVLDYLDLCQKFWVTDRGTLDAWRDVINDGRIPDFMAHLYY